MRKIYTEEFVAAGIEAMYDLASQIPYKDILVVVPTIADFDSENEIGIGPIVANEEVWNRISEDDYKLSTYLGRQSFSQIVDEVAEQHNPNMENKPRIMVSEPVVEVALEPYKDGYRFVGQAAYRLKEEK